MHNNIACNYFIGEIISVVLVENWYHTHKEVGKEGQKWI
jgi:hypothetical protein